MPARDPAGPVRGAGRGDGHERRDRQLAGARRLTTARSPPPSAGWCAATRRRSRSLRTTRRDFVPVPDPSRAERAEACVVVPGRSDVLPRWHLRGRDHARRGPTSTCSSTTGAALQVGSAATATRTRRSRLAPSAADRDADGRTSTGSGTDGAGCERARCSVGARTAAAGNTTTLRRRDRRRAVRQTHTATFTGLAADTRYLGRGRRTAAAHGCRPRRCWRSDTP